MMPPVRGRRQLEPADLMTIAEAVKLLGVSLPTMRRWDESGKVPARRHPIIGYLMYARAEVMKLRREIVEGARAT